MTLSWERAFGRPTPVPGKTCRPFKPNISHLRSNYDRRLQHNHHGGSLVWRSSRYTLERGTWVNHVIPPRSCITLEDNTSSQSLLKKSFMLLTSTPETHRRRKHWLEMMLSSIKDRSGFRFELSLSFGLRHIFRLFVTIPVYSVFGFAHSCCAARTSLVSTVSIPSHSWSLRNVQGPWSVSFFRGVTFYGHRSTLWFSWSLNL